MMKTSYWLKNQWIWKQFSLVLKIRCLIFFEQKLAILMIVARLNLVVALERNSVRFIPCPSYQFSAPHFWRALPNVPTVDLSYQSRNLLYSSQVVLFRNPYGWFVKYIYVVAKKMTRNGCKMSNSHSCGIYMHSEYIYHFTSHQKNWEKCLLFNLANDCLLNWAKSQNDFWNK